MQDSKGYIWGATDAGVFRYNNTGFTVFTTKEGAPDNTVFNLFEDKTGKIWMTGFNGQIAYFLNDKFYKIACSDKIAKQLKNGRRVIYSIYVNAKNEVWLGTASSLLKIDPKNNYELFIEFSDYADTVNTIIIEPEKGAIISSKVFSNNTSRSYLNQSKQNYSFNVEVNITDYKPFFTIVKPNKVNHQPIHRHLLLSDGRILLAYINDLYILSKNGTVEKKEFEQSIISLYEDAKKNIWVGLSKGGALQFQNLNLKEKPITNLPGLSVSSVCADFENGLWLSSLENGLYYANTLGLKVYNDIPGLEEKIIETTVINDTVWAVNTKHDIFIIDKQSRATLISSLPYLSAMDVFNVYQHKGIKYTAGIITGIANKKFNKFESLKLRGTDFASAALSFYKDDKGYFAISSTDLVEAENQSVINHYDLPARGKALCITEDKNIYVGTLNGLYLFKDKKFLELKTQNKLFASRISDIKLIRNEVIAICTRANGVLIKDKNVLIQISMSDGLASDICNSVTLGLNNDLWVATNKGVSHILFEANSFKIKNLRNYDITNGLPSNEVNKIALRHNELWLGTKKGLAVIYLNDAVYNTEPPKTYIKNLFINEVVTNYSKSLELNYDENNLKFYIDVLNYKDASKINFKYKLSGQSEIEKEGNSNLLEFNNLTHGNYTLYVTGLNNNGIASKTIVYSFAIKKPFWLTWWFIVAEVLLGIFLIAGIIVWRLNAIEKREQEKTRINKELAEYQMMALRAQMNPHFIFNAINSIQEYILQKNHKEAYTYLTKFSHLIRQVLNNANESVISLSREFETLKLYVELEQLRFENSFIFNLDIDKAIDIENILVPSMIIQPFIENAIWHGIMPLEGIRKGVIKVEVKPNNTGAYIIIEDNGVGRQKSAEIKKTPGHKSLGMQLTKQRLDVLSKQIDTGKSQMAVSDLKDENNNSCGTRIELWIS